MKYNFDKITDRRCSNSLKWDVAENELPMWVADMDFPTAPEITEALKKRADHGIFGYSVIPEAWYQAYISWWETRHHFRFEKEWLSYVTGVIPAISTAVRTFTEPGEKVLVLSPIYNHFFISIEDNGREAVESRLVYRDGAYSIDYDDFEAKLADADTTLLILSNPHNPTGNIWDREELKKIGELCEKHQVLVIADEIHCDLTDPGYEYTPFAGVSEACRENSITCIAPTKAFNIAGLQTAATVIPNDTLREKMDEAAEAFDLTLPGAFAADAAIAAFTKGGPWLDALREYLAENKACVSRFIEENLPQVKVIQSNATYLMWIDFGKITDDALDLCKHIRKETGLYLNVGQIYRGNGKTFARLNAACPRALIEDGMARLKRGIESYQR